MARSVRIQYSGATYHVVCRGDRREAIFRNDGDRIRFLETLGEACERAGFRIHSYVLMGNHYHLLLETPNSNLVAGMQWFQGTYTARFNARHRMSGHLFQGRYKAIPIDDEEPGCFRVVSEYIHLNPARAGLLDAEKPRLISYPWSSFPAFVGASPLPSWLVRRRVFAALDLSDEGRSSRCKFTKRLELRTREVLTGDAGEELEEEWSVLRRGWYVGGETFRDRLMDLASRAVSGHRRRSYEAPALARHDDQEGERLLDAAIRALGITRDELRGFRQNDPRKQAVAWLMMSRTVVGGRWIAERLDMGDTSNISRAFAAYRMSKDQNRKRLKQGILQACKD